MLELTEDTKKVIDVLFSPKSAKRMKERLQREIADQPVFEVFDTAESKERIWLAVIKKCKETMNSWDTWFELAKLDWRDLLMAADFGHDTSAHIKWKDEVIIRRGD